MARVVPVPRGLMPLVCGTRIAGGAPTPNVALGRSHDWGLAEIVATWWPTARSRPPQPCATPISEANRHSTHTARCSP